MSVNKVMLRGFVGRTPELYNGMAKFTLATEENYKDNNGNWIKKTEWHNIIAFGKTAERAMEKIRKGDMIAIDDGKLSHREYENKQGQKIQTTGIVITNFEVLKKSDKYANQDKPPALEQQTFNPDEDSELPF